MLRKSGHLRERSGLWHRIRTLRSLKQMHAHILTRGAFPSDRSSLRELIFSSAISVPNAFPYALHLFDQIPHPDHFVVATLIRGASHSRDPSLALSLYSRVPARGPHRLALPFVLRACTALSSPASSAAQLHSRAVRIGLEDDVFVRNSLLSFHARCGDLSVAARLFGSARCRHDVVARSSLVAGYAKRGHLGLARKLFDETENKDLVSWNVMITGYAKRGEMGRARELFDRVPRKDTVSWNVMIGGYARCGMQDEAMEVFREMRAAGGRPDDVTMLSLISACADTGALDVGRRLHSSLEGGLTVVLGNALIDMYAKCGSIEMAVEVFRGMREKDVSSWNSVIGGLAMHGHSGESVCVFEDMRKGRVRPDEITFVGVLVACSHGGMVEDGRRYFDLMRNMYGIKPNVKHYGCMVDILGRAGLLEEAFGFVDGLEAEANSVIWRALLGHSRNHGNVQLGERANKELLKMKWREESGSGDYVLLSNIYASMGDWRRSEKVRRLMDDNRVMKEAGCAHIEADR